MLMRQVPREESDVDELRKKLQAEIAVSVERAHYEARKVLEATADLPNAIDAAHRAVSHLVRATALREMLDEM